MLQVVDEVAHASGLGFKVSMVVLVRSHLHRYASDHVNPQSLHPLYLERIVGHKLDALGIPTRRRNGVRDANARGRGDRCKFKGTGMSRSS